MTSDFEPPPNNVSKRAAIGAVVTSVIAIAGLNWLSADLIRTQKASVESSGISMTQGTSPVKPAEVDPEKLAKLDAESLVLPGDSINPKQVQISFIPYIAANVGKVTPAEKAIARQAWSYFQRNWNDETGLVNSIDGFSAVTIWDQAGAMAALVSAKELNIVSASEFEKKMGTMLQTLATMPLYKKELPNKVYNSKTLLPVNYGQLEKREEIGWSAIDVGRMALWLKIVGTKYPQWRSPTEEVWQHWQVKRLTRKGQIYGTSVVKGKEQYKQEGRLGYENYAAYGLQLWGLKVNKALEYQANTAYANLYGQGIPYDKRDYDTSGANNYVLSEPYILDGIETGFQSLPKVFADRILAAQEARYRATKQLTAVTEDNLDRSPYFLSNSLFVNGQPWVAITDTREQHQNLRFVSTKAAIGWHVLYNTDYTRKLSNFVLSNLQSDQGWYNGYYESLRQPNTSLTANNNSVILSSLLYKQVGKPLTVWAGL
ncbi:DUF3131 domain-containing protein [Nodularia sphaerocarpa]|uniref:DUF3131 domain-containing protein n=1 Tax=Nodularia sphaerocarpa TaxID=137816 RepID=UPI001EFA7F0A|nr:DUF3131 domain-containing protein [Nodularia sphaerocarpa]MDB9375685.1 DUF3131 domain-containing protein [Nodularia sphaerocarpa CS-585]MDB9378213.1 DUF3131 domain-containing protein [Nodularia sphaerocarpa CS-585A2]ULP70923.1 hypothetical protein BDGGKGIB_00545 [Nodularia sphaerocarpa UHCC 0038]